MLNIVVPMAGRGSRFANAGYDLPKPLIDVGGRPMIYWVVENIRPARPHRFIFICQAEHLNTYPDAFQSLKAQAPGCEMVTVENVTEGAACTVLLAKNHIDNDNPLMIANSDQVVDVNINSYLEAMDCPGIDGLIMTFWSDHPKWSFCRMSNGKVTEVVEKQVVSNCATVGIYNFKRGADFVEAAETMITQDRRVNGEFYVAPAYNETIAKGANIAVFDIGSESERMFGLGTPEDLQKFTTLDYFKKRSIPKGSG